MTDKKYKVTSKQKLFTARSLGRFYYFRGVPDLLYSIVGNAGHCFKAQVWRYAPTGRLYMVGLDTVLLTQAMRPDMRELSLRTLAPYTAAGELGELLLQSSHWCVRSIYGGHD